MYTDVGAYELAMKVLNEGLRFTPEDVGLMEALGLAWLDMGEPTVARGGGGRETSRRAPNGRCRL